MNDKTNPLNDSTFATVQRIDPDQTQDADANLGHIGPYKLVRELGRGGMGAVFLAKHNNLQRTLAIKVLPREFANSPDRIERFRREMAAIGRLEHPNIVLATDAGEMDGVAYIAMQYLDGHDVGALLKRDQTLSISDVCEIVRQAATGLQHVLECGLVHRDIKPSNLFLTKNGEIKILDLGLAMLRENDGLAAAITSPNTIMGTPDYIAPEQINSSHEVDIRADIYSLGCTLYTLLAGRAPFEGKQYSTTTSKLIAHAEKQAVSLKSIRSDVPDGLVHVIEKMMAKSPRDRFSQPKQVADALISWSVASNLRTLADTDRIGTQTHSKKDRLHSVPRSPWIIALSSIGSIAIVIAGMTFLWNGRKDESSTNTVVRNEQLESPTVQSESNPSPNADASDNLSTSSSVTSKSSATSKPNESPSTLASSLDTSIEQISKSAQSIESSNLKVEENTRKIAQSFDELLKHLNSSQPKQLVKDPQTPGELYYNALVYGMQGNPRMARQTFLAYFDLNQDYIDPHLKFIESLTLQEGKAAVRETYKMLPGDRSLLSRQFVEASLLETEPRKEMLQSLASKNEDFAPVWFALSTMFTAAPGSPQTLHEAFSELENLKRFSAAHDRGGLLKYFLDQSEAATMLNRADTRLKALEQIDRERFDRPVSLPLAMKLSDKWQAIFEIAEPAKEIFVRLGETGEFQSLGTNIGIDSVTGYPIPKKSYMIPGEIANDSLFVRYMDLKNHMCGPYRVPFDAKEQTKKWEIYSIQQTKSNWLRLTQDRLFFDVFHSGRSVLKEVRYGIDTDLPNKTKNIPKAELSPENSQEYHDVVPETAKYAVIQLIFTDESKSEIVRIERR